MSFPRNFWKPFLDLPSFRVGNWISTGVYIVIEGFCTEMIKKMG